MRKHIKSIGNYNIIAETINDDDIIYNVENYCKLIDWFTTQELAEQFIVEAIGL